MVMLPYTVGVSEDIRRVCRKYGIKVILMCGLSLYTVLTKVKDTSPISGEAVQGCVPNANAIYVHQ